MTRTNTLVMYALLSIASMLSATVPPQYKELKKFKEFVEITFNNHPDDTNIFVNDFVKITPTRKNVTINGVKKVEVQKTDGFVLALLLIQHLQNTNTITVTKNEETGEHTVTLT